MLSLSERLGYGVMDMGHEHGEQTWASNMGIKHGHQTWATHIGKALHIKCIVLKYLRCCNFRMSNHTSPCSSPSRDTEVTSSTAPSTSGSKARLPPCKICKEKASGFHYGVNACQGCKVNNM